MCETGKMEYPNVRSARAALHQCQKSRKYNRKRREVSFYRCKHCHSLHLTSVPENGETRFT